MKLKKMIVITLEIIILIRKIKKKFIVLSLVVFCFSCKKEINESEAISEIKTNISTNINKEDFNKNTLPLIEELVKKDSVKYKMIQHIANKAKMQNNKEIFKLNLQNLSEELKYVVPVKEK